MMYDIREINDHARQLARVLQSLANEINSAVTLLKKPDGINRHFVEIHRLENEADEIISAPPRAFYVEKTDPIALIKWKELYEILENGPTAANRSPTSSKALF